MTTKNEIADWFREGKRQKAQYMIVACDTFDHEDYPAYAKSDEECLQKYKELNGQNMQRVMEVYDLRKDLTAQLECGRAMNLPKGA